MCWGAGGFETCRFLIFLFPGFHGRPAGSGCAGLLWTSPSEPLKGLAPLPSILTWRRSLGEGRWKGRIGTENKKKMRDK